jgi:FkbM family methyltransferase
MEALMSHELYKIQEKHFVKTFLREFKVDCVFDIGANNGQYTEMLKEIGYAGLIVLFEGHPECLRTLKEKFGDDPQCLILPRLVADHDGYVDFNIQCGDQFSSILQPMRDEANLFNGQNATIRTEKVRCVTLDTAFSLLQETFEFTAPFLKMDTQGFDFDIVAASKTAIKQFVGLQSELSIKPIYQHTHDFKDSLSLYDSLGFDVTYFIMNNRGHFPYLLETDVIMVNRLVAKDYIRPENFWNE